MKKSKSKRARKSPLERRLIAIQASLQELSSKIETHDSKAVGSHRILLFRLELLEQRLPKRASGQEEVQTQEKKTEPLGRPEKYVPF